MAQTRPGKGTRDAGRWRGLLKKMGLLGLSSLLVIVALEGIFRAVGYVALYDVYSRPEIFWTKDELLGWSLQPGAEGSYVGPRPFPIAFRTRIRINSLGLRGPDPLPLPSGGKRVLFLGDSQTAGFEVDEARTFASLTGKKLNEMLAFDVQVINAGVRGYGTDQASLLYETRLRKLRADLVVYNPTSNDPEDNTTLHRPRRPFGKAAFALQNDGSTKLVGHPIPDYPTCSSYRLDPDYRAGRVDSVAARMVCGLETRLSDRSALFSFATTRLRQSRLIDKARNLGGSPPGRPSGLPAAAAAEPVTLSFENRLTSAIIQKIAGLAETDGARFLLLADGSDLANLDTGALKARGMQIVRPNDVLGADQRPFRFPNDGHLNEEGHRRVAELLAPRAAELLNR